MHSDKPKVFNSVEEASQHIKPIREKGKTLVTTNGCFDLVHAGHIQYLFDAAAYGDILIVGINADSTVKKLKGAQRPIQKDADRALLIASLKVVDCTFIFKEYDPRAFLEILKPDIHIKGGDYTPEELPERSIVEKHGGKIVIVPFAPGYSTSSIIKKITGPSVPTKNGTE